MYKQKHTMFASTGLRKKHWPHRVSRKGERESIQLLRYQLINQQIGWMNKGGDLRVLKSEHLHLPLQSIRATTHTFRKNQTKSTARVLTMGEGDLANAKIVIVRDL